MQMQQCPHCGAAVPAGDRFCGECGKPMNVEAPAPPPSAAQEPVLPAWQPPPPQPAAPPAWQPQANPLGASTGTASGQTLTSRENMAIAALVLGVINLCGWILPICGVPLALLGIGLGVYSLNSRRRTIAIVGLVLCGLTLLGAILSAALGVANSITGG